MSDEEVVLDHDDLRRTLVRIAHEIVEKNEDGDRLALVGIHTRGAIICRRLHALVGELSGSEVPLGDLDISFYRDDLGRRARRGAGRPRLPISTSTSRAGRSSSSTTCSTPGGRSAPRSTPSSTTAAGAGAAGRARRSRPPGLPIRPDYVGKNLPTALGSG